MFIKIVKILKGIKSLIPNLYPLSIFDFLNVKKKK
jgi:hypothetical protein